MERFLSVKEVAKRYSTSTKTIYLWVRQGVLPAFRMKPYSAMLFRERDLEKIERQRTTV